MTDSITFSGLYYPHTTADDESVLKTALLLWDELRFIVPYGDFPLRSDSNDKLLDEAYEIIGRPHAPSDTEKQLAHDQIEELLQSPESLAFLSAPDNTLTGRYEIYPQKFLNSTWKMLEERRLTEQSGRDEFLMGLGNFEDYVTSHRFGLTLMLSLAEACAGTTRRLITDRTPAYHNLNLALASSVTEEEATKDEYDRIVTRSIKMVDPSRIKLSSLVAMRRAEAGTNGHHLRKLRHNYLEMIDRFASQLNAASEVDLPEIQRLQDQEMKQSLAELRDALKDASTDALHQKELFVAMVAAAGISIAPLAIPAGVTSIIALNKTRIKHRKDRRSAMADHAMSWLVEASQQGRIRTY